MDKHYRNAFDMLHMSEEKSSRCLGISVQNVKEKPRRFPKIAWQPVFWHWLFLLWDLQEENNRHILCP